MNGLLTLPLAHSSMPPSQKAGSKQPETKEAETLTHRNGPSVPFNLPPESLMPERRALESQEKQSLQIARETTPKTRKGTGVTTCLYSRNSTSPIMRPL